MIGADGINSTIRQLAIADGAAPYARRLSWRAVISYDYKSLSRDEVTLFTSPDGKNMMLIDVGGESLFWSTGSLSEDAAMSQSAADTKSRVLEEFAGWAKPLEEIIQATDAEKIVKRPICNRPPLTT